MGQRGGDDYHHLDDPSHRRWAGPLTADCSADREKHEAEYEVPPLWHLRFVGDCKGMRVSES